MLLELISTLITFSGIAGSNEKLSFTELTLAKKKSKNYENAKTVKDLE